MKSNEKQWKTKNKKRTKTTITAKAKPKPATATTTTAEHHKPQQRKQTNKYFTIFTSFASPEVRRGALQLLISPLGSAAAAATVAQLWWLSTNHRAQNMRLCPFWGHWLAKTCQQFCWKIVDTIFFEKFFKQKKSAWCCYPKTLIRLPGRIDILK